MTSEPVRVESYRYLSLLEAENENAPPLPSCRPHNRGDDVGAPAHRSFYLLPGIQTASSAQVYPCGRGVGIRPTTWATAHVASLSRNIEMPRATAARILEELKLSGWIEQRGKYYLLKLDRLEEPGYAEYFEEAERRIAIAKKKLSELDIPNKSTLARTIEK